MELKSQISFDLNQEKVGKKFKVLIDRKDGGVLLEELNLIQLTLIMKC